jgi:hypothetical protein
MKEIYFVIYLLWIYARDLFKNKCVKIAQITDPLKGNN